MTGNNGDERDPNSLYIGRRLSYIAFMVLGAFFIVPWENPSTGRLLFAAIFYGLLIYYFIHPLKRGRWW